MAMCFEVEKVSEEGEPPGVDYKDVRILGERRLGIVFGYFIDLCLRYDHRRENALGLSQEFGPLDTEVVHRGNIISC